jgi:hypothetical protein
MNKVAADLRSAGRTCGGRDTRSMTTHGESSRQHAISFREWESHLANGVCPKTNNELASV